VTLAESLINQGKLEGKIEGKTLGIAEGKTLAILRVLEKRGLPITGDQKHRIISCTDAATLDAWLDAAITASTIDELLG
jgi:hypothetical protein